jgi:hypothetical protein
VRKSIPKNGLRTTFWTLTGELGTKMAPLTRPDPVGPKMTIWARTGQVRVTLVHTDQTLGPGPQGRGHFGHLDAHDAHLGQYGQVWPNGPKGLHGLKGPKGPLLWP